MYTPRLYKSIYQVRFDKKLSFFEKLSQLSGSVDDFEFWEYSNTSLTLRDRVKHLNLSFSNGDCSVSIDSSDDSLEIERKLICEIEKNFDISSFIRVGHRRFFLVKIDFSFEDLVQVLSVRLANADTGKVIPGSLQDLRYTFVTEGEDFEYHIVVGPVRQNEIARHIGTEPRNFQSNDDLHVFTSKHPEIALFIDVDCYTSDKKNLTELDKLLEKDRKSVV